MTCFISCGAGKRLARNELRQEESSATSSLRQNRRSKKQNAHRRTRSTSKYEQTSVKVEMLFDDPQQCMVAHLLQHHVAHTIEATRIAVLLHST